MSSHQPTNVLIMQTDNRKDVDYMGLSKLANTIITDYLRTTKHYSNFHYEYKFIQMEPRHYENIHPATGKIYVMDEILHNEKYDIIVFLDSDAWVQNPDSLHQLLIQLVETPSAQGAFSRDPYINRNTYINSGSFVLKANDYTRQLYKQMIDFAQNDKSKHTSWPYDQYYISQKIFENKDSFMIFIPHVLNTPYGEILRHNWWKNQKMFRDLYDLLDKYRPLVNIPIYDFAKQIDNEVWPNPSDKAHEYY